MALFEYGKTYIHSGMGKYLKNLPVRFGIDAAQRQAYKNGVDTPDVLVLREIDKDGIEWEVKLKQTKITLIGWECERVKKVGPPDVAGIF